MLHGYPDFQGGKYGLLDEAALAEREGTYKALNAAGGGKAYSESITLLYKNLSGKTLYVNLITATATASAVANADANQICLLEVYTPNIATLQAYAGGNGGVVIPLPQRIKVVNGGLFIAFLSAYANHLMDLRVSARGYEI